MRGRSPHLPIFQTLFCFLNSWSQKLFTALILAEMTFWKRSKHCGSLLCSTLAHCAGSSCVCQVGRNISWGIWSGWRPGHASASWLKAKLCFWMALTRLWSLHTTGVCWFLAVLWHAIQCNVLFKHRSLSWKEYLPLEYQESSARGKCTCRELLFLLHTQTLPYSSQEPLLPLHLKPAWSEGTGAFGEPSSPSSSRWWKGRRAQRSLLPMSTFSPGRTSSNLPSTNFSEQKTPKLPLSQTLLTEASEQQTRCSTQSLVKPGTPVHSCPISLALTMVVSFP